MVIMLSWAGAVKCQDCDSAEGYHEYILPWDDGCMSAVNVSHLLDPPAGKHGFCRVGEDGEFWFHDEKCDEWTGPVRFWGTQLWTGAATPTYDEADKISDRFAKFGFNALRIGIIVHPQPGVSGSGQWDHGEERDRYFYFMHCLKERGIYISLQLIPGSGRKWEKIFDAELIEHWKAMATELLTTVSPYTGLAFRDDPQLATIEIINEDTLFRGWIADCLHWDEDPGDYKWPWSPVDREHSDMLDALWNGWLNDGYADDAALAAAWSGGQEPLGETDLIDGTGDFEGQIDPSWSLLLTEPAEAELFLDAEEAAVGDFSARVDITVSGGLNDVDFRHSWVEVVPGEHYSLTLRAKASSP